MAIAAAAAPHKQPATNGKADTMFIFIVSLFASAKVRPNWLVKGEPQRLARSKAVG
jgi:hypothetical protein